MSDFIPTGGVRAAGNARSTMRFECNGLTFRVNSRHRHWTLAYWQGDRWISLSSWRTRKEAINAAEHFIPADGFNTPYRTFCSAACANALERGGA